MEIQIFSFVLKPITILGMDMSTGIPDGRLNNVVCF